MDITKFSQKKIKEGLEKAGLRDNHQSESIRVLFSPRRITNENFYEVCHLYSRIKSKDFDTVVIIESHPGSAEKKLPMPSFKFAETKFGRVPANDSLRNDFADEDDDFFINDDAFDENVSFYDQLMMLQCTLENFSVLSIQITDESPFIIKELGHALEEILASKNALIVFCCDLKNENREDLENIIQHYKSDNFSGLMNYLNSEESSVEGLGALVAGLILAKRWGLKIHLDVFDEENINITNLLNGYAVMQRQPIYR